MKKIHINEKIEVVIDRKETNFDRACDSARSLIIMMLGSDVYGNMNNVDGFNRSTDYIEITFVSYKAVCTMVGISHEYVFSGCVKRNNESEQDVNEH